MTTNCKPCNDTRYVYGATCTWHGPIQEIKTRSGLPACPHCGGLLMEYASRAEWDVPGKKFAEERGLKYYMGWLESLRVGHCLPLRGWDWEASYNTFVAVLFNRGIPV